MKEIINQDSEIDYLFNFYKKIGTVLDCLCPSPLDSAISLKTSAGYWPNLMYFNGKKEEFDDALSFLNESQNKVFISKRDTLNQEHIKLLQHHEYFPCTFWQGMDLDLADVQPTKEANIINKENTIPDLLNILLKQLPLKDSNFAKIAQIPGIMPFCLNQNGQSISTATAFIEGQTAGLYYVITDPYFRKQGFATTLLSNVLHYLSQHNVKKVVLQASFEGVPLYQKFGFKKTGTFVLFRKFSF